jgi:DNA repair photolyase
LKKGPSWAYLGQAAPVLKKGVVNEEHAYHLAMAEIIENRDEIIRDGGLFMTFTSDPCMMETYDLFADINFWACNHGIPVTILTKCAYDIPKKCEGIPKRPCFSPFCISSKMLAIGWTLTGHDELEPNAAPNSERLRYMKMASDKGMMTWASIEPVIDFPSSLDMIYQALNAGCQHFKIGLLTNNTRVVRKDFQIGVHQFKAYDVRDCLHFVEDVMRMTAGKATVYWKQSVRDLFDGDGHIILDQWPHSVGKNYSLFNL